MAKITFIGAGSTIFSKNLLVDILSKPELAESTILLHDISASRLEVTEKIAHHFAGQLAPGARIVATTDRRAALDGADYAISMFQVGGYKPATVTDFEIPRKYGLRQTIGDTLGIGGIMRGLRTIPVLMDMAGDMAELCPNVLHLNYVNSLAMNCWALSRTSTIQTIGLCHSVQGTARQLAEDIGVPVDEIDYLAAGINHLAFYLRFERNGEDLYPLIDRVIQDERIPHWNRVRYDAYQRLGYFVTESSEHFSEYVSWYIKADRDDLLEQFNIPLDEYLERCQAQDAMWEFIKSDVERGDFDNPFLDLEPSEEYAAGIIQAVEGGVPFTFYGNVANKGLISNLPHDCCVEVPCHVENSRVEPQAVGALPPQLAALMQTNINVQSLTVEAALTRRREHIYHAALMDPHTAAELDPDQVWALVNDLIEAHGDLMPEYR